MKEIYLIGGGKSLKESNMIYDDMIFSANKEIIKVLFIPTGRYDEERYISYVEDYFNKKGCHTSSLKLGKNKINDYQINNLIDISDIIYVGGGDTKHLIDIWTETGLDQILINGWKHDKFILSGLSAGSICRCKSGNSRMKELDGTNDYRIIEGFGILPIIHCPHYNEIDRKKARPDFVKKSGMVGIAIDDYCCLVIKNDNYRIIKSKPGAEAYKCYWNNGVFIEEILNKNGDTESLFKIN